MSHYDYVRPNGVWINAFVFQPFDLQQFDYRITKTLNGDDGGTWNPTTPIILAGTPGGGTTLSVSAGGFNGGVSTARGGRIHSSSPATFSSNRSRTVDVGFIPSIPDTAPGFGKWLLSAELPGVVSVGGTAGVGGMSTTLWIPQNRIHTGATLSSVVIYWACGQLHTSIASTTLPTFDVQRFSIGSTSPQSLRSGGAVSVSAATAAIYYNKGAIQTVTYTPDQHNTSLDTHNWTYGVVFTDEASTNSLGPTLNTVMGAVLTFTSIPDTSPE